MLDIANSTIELIDPACLTFDYFILGSLGFYVDLVVNYVPIIHQLCRKRSSQINALIKQYLKPKIAFEEFQNPSLFLE